MADVISFLCASHTLLGCNSETSHILERSATVIAFRLPAVNAQKSVSRDRRLYQPSSEIWIWHTVEDRAGNNEVRNLTGGLQHCYFARRWLTGPSCSLFRAINSSRSSRRRRRNRHEVRRWEDAIHNPEWETTLITAARPAYAGTEGCSILHVFFISLFFYLMSNL